MVERQGVVIGRWVRVMVVVLVAASMFAPGAAGAADDATWHTVDDDGEAVTRLFFVYSSTCPHCREAMPFIAELEDRHDWLDVVWLQADSGDPRVADVALGVAAELGASITGVPTFMYCETMSVGYDSADGAGARLEASLIRCHDEFRSSVVPEPAAPVTTTTAPTTSQSVNLPIIGEVAADQVSLPVFTVAVAALDAFNPCAFFVLLFLLSLLVHARSRAKMAAIGGVFVLVSGVVYFAFMAAWLNVFLVFGPLRWVTAAAGAIAVGLAVVNLRDYFSHAAGFTLAIPESRKPGLFSRMRSLTAGDRWPTLLVGTVVLAVAANSYELLCTAGLPMVFTRVLTLNELSTPTYYGYLVAYNVVYVIPLLVIVAGFVWALGSRKLQAREARTLKLLSGSMMLGLGLVLLLAPDLLESMVTGLAVIGTALVATAVIAAVDRRRGRNHRPRAAS